jgi:hypothetical protein
VEQHHPTVIAIIFVSPPLQNTGGAKNTRRSFRHWRAIPTTKLTPPNDAPGPQLSNGGGVEA